MCRYGMSGPYKPHYACFACRRAFKQSANAAKEEVRCPECAEPVHDMGLDFKPPRKTDAKQWEKVRILFQHGFAFHSCGCCGPGLRPQELNQVQQFLADHLSQSEGERLLAQIQEHTRRRTAPARS